MLVFREILRMYKMNDTLWVMFIVPSPNVAEKLW